MNQKIVCIGLAMVAAVAVSGCGGGGGGAMIEPGLFGTEQQADPATVAATVGEAAQSTPRQGSVMQSSNTDVDGVTKGTVNVDARYVDGRITFEATYDEEGDGTPDVRLGADDVFSREVGLQICQQCADTDPDKKWQAAVLQKRDGSGTLVVSLFTDLQPDDPSGTDYMAGGMWLYVPDDTEEVDDLQFGAFGDASDPFDGSSIVMLTGTATYTGDATGAYTAKGSESDSGEVGLFDAFVQLTADFGTLDNLGTVSGRVYNPVLSNGEESSLQELMLEEAPITEQEGGFFRGETSGTDSGQTGYSGKWGGQFIGNGADYPESVGGTFGASRNDGLVNLFGVFGAYKQ